MKHKSAFILLLFAFAGVFQQNPAYAQFGFGETAVLTQILAKSVSQLSSLMKIQSTSKGSIELLQEINRGIHDAAAIVNMMNRTLRPGTYSDLSQITEILDRLKNQYGGTADTIDRDVQNVVDQSVAEAIYLHNQGFKYADRLDIRGEEIKQRAAVVSPTGAAKLQSQALGVIVHQNNQIIRLNSAILKLQSNQLAIENMKEKRRSHHFKAQYTELSKAFSDTEYSYNLPSLSD